MTESVTPGSGPPGSEEARARRLRRFTYLVLIAAATGLALAAIARVEPLLSANDRSRWTTVWSLVERGTFHIDEIIRHPGWQTIDMVRHEGHFYSSKPALLSTLVAGVYWSVKQATGWDLLARTELVARVILVLVNLIPWTIALALVAAMVERYAQFDRTRIFVVLTACFGTLLTPFLVTLNNHTVAAASLVFALYPALRIVADGSRSPVHFALAGFFAAFTCTNELPAALFGVALFGLLLWRAPRLALLVFVPAALVPLGAYFWTTYLQTGGWKPFYLYYGTEKYNYVHEGVPSYWMHPTGLDRATDAPAVYLLHCTFGHHGIWSLSPVFLLTLASWGRLLGGRRAAPRSWSAFEWMGLGLTLAVLAFYMTRTENYNYGGNTAALRWMLWLVPFWLLGMIPALDRWLDRRWFRGAAATALLISVFSAVYPLENPWSHPWLFQWLQARGWISYPPEPPPRFERTLTTWFGSLPPQGEWVEFATVEPNGRTSTLRLNGGGTDRHAGAELYRMEIVWNPGASDERRDVLHIDVKAFAAGGSPEEFLRWPDGQPSEGERDAAAALLRGMPAARKYHEGVVRYQKTPLRPHEAFRCQLAASRVRHRPSESRRSFWFRCDTWLCDDLPFGTLRADFTITDAGTGEVANQQIYRAVAVSGFVSREAAIVPAPLISDGGPQ